MKKNCLRLLTVIIIIFLASCTISLPLRKFPKKYFVIAVSDITLHEDININVALTSDDLNKLKNDLISRLKSISKFSQVISGQESQNKLKEDAICLSVALTEFRTEQILWRTEQKGDNISVRLLGQIKLMDYLTQEVFYEDIVAGCFELHGDKVYHVSPCPGQKWRIFGNPLLYREKSVPGWTAIDYAKNCLIGNIINVITERLR